MNIRTAHHGFRETGKFTTLILDYLDEQSTLGVAHAGAPNLDNVRRVMEYRRSCLTDRTRLVEVLQEQYKSVDVTSVTQSQIESLSEDNTFTITTAHQCNIFLGPLYTIFKTLHAIRMADSLNQQMAGYHFVPVFYMGSEDADLDELNHIHLFDETLEWKTEQRGAVGRMIVDDELRALIERQKAILGGLPFGSSWCAIIERCYHKGSTLAEATFKLLHELFAGRGLIVLQPDEKKLKSTMIDLFWNELKNRSAVEQVAVGDTILSNLGYTPQAHARNINLFYLQKGRRERIESAADEWVLADNSKRWNAAQLQAELKEHPDRFSPNVILRGIYQEMILPNVCYVGGGGELAYWLQLKPLFEFHRISFPLLQLRASIQWMEPPIFSRLEALGLQPTDLFRSANSILDDQIRQQQTGSFDFQTLMKQVADLYGELKRQASMTDPTLGPHVESLQVKALKKIGELEKKMLRAERRKLTDKRFQIESLQRLVFPGNGLQERWENIGYYYSKYGKSYLDHLYAQIDPFGKSFTWLIESD